MDLSDYYISVFLNNANITEVCGLWVVSRMQSPQGGFVFGWWSGKGTQQFSVSDCINLQSVHLQTEHQAFLLWGCTQPVGLGAWEPWMQFLLLCPDLSSRVCSDFLSGTGDRFEQRPNSEAEKCTFSPFLPAAHDHALHNTSLPNSFCLKVLLSKLL